MKDPKAFLSASYAGAVAGLGVATCCVMPMILVLLGLGGSWMAVFAKVAAVSYYVLAASTLLVAAAWYVSYRRRSPGRIKAWLAGSTLLTLVAWMIVLNESRINDYLINWM